MPWKNRYPPTDVTSEDNGPPDEPPFDEGDDDDLEFGWPISQEAAGLLDNVYRFLHWKRGLEARDL